MKFCDLLACRILLKCSDKRRQEGGFDFFKLPTSCTIPLFFNNMSVTLRSTTCFEQHAAHPQEDQLYHHSLWYRHSSQTAVQYAGGERTAIRSPPAYCTAAYRGWRYQRLWWYNLSSWRWAACCSKHVEERSVTYSWKIKELCIKLVIWKSL